MAHVTEIRGDYVASLIASICNWRFGSRAQGLAQSSIVEKLGLAGVNQQGIKTPPSILVKTESSRAR